MRYLDRFIHNMQYSFLEIAVYDEDDVAELAKFKSETNIIMDLNYLCYLPLFPHVERLILRPGMISHTALADLKMLKELKALTLDYVETESGTDYCVDISVFPKLEYLFSRSSCNFCGVEHSKTLKTLIVGHWYQCDLCAIQHSKLDTLCIFSGNLSSLKGIEEIPLLILSIGYQKKLASVGDISHLPLKILEIDHCNKIKDLELLASHSIEYLMINGRNTVKSLAFLSNIKNLKRVMLDMQIENGDLAILDSLEKATIFTDKRHFNRKDTQLPKSAKQYLVFEIPEWRYLYNDRMI